VSARTRRRPRWRATDTLLLAVAAVALVSPSTTTAAVTHVNGALTPVTDRLAQAVTDRIFGTLTPATPVPTAPPSGTIHPSSSTISTEGRS